MAQSNGSDDSALALATPDAASLRDMLQSQIDSVGTSFMHSGKELMAFARISGAVQFPAILRQVFDKTQYSTAVQLQVLNVAGVDVADDHRGPGYVELDVLVNSMKAAQHSDMEVVQGALEYIRSSSGTQTSGAGKGRLVPTGERYTVREMHVYRFSAETVEKSCEIGKPVMVRGVRAQLSFFNKKDERGALTNELVYTVFLNASRVDPIGELVESDVYWGLTGNPDFVGSRLEPCDTPYNDADKDGRYADDIKVLYVSQDVASKVTVPDGSVCVRLPNNCDWTIKDVSSTDRPFMSMPLHVTQWTGPHFTPATSRNALVVISAYSEVLACTGLTSNVDLWRELAEPVFESLSFVAVGQVDLKNTHHQPINVSRNNPQFQYALAIKMTAMFADIPAHYQRIGVPVTREYALEHRLKARAAKQQIGAASAAAVGGGGGGGSGSSDGSAGGGGGGNGFKQNRKAVPPHTVMMPLGVAQSQAAVLRPRVVNIDDFVGTEAELEALMTLPGVEFRAIVNLSMVEQQCDALARLTPKDGDVLMKNAGRRITGYPKDHPIHECSLNKPPASLRSAVLAVINPPREKRVSTSDAKTFITGLAKMSSLDRTAGQPQLALAGPADRLMLGPPPSPQALDDSVASADQDAHAAAAAAAAADAREYTDVASDGTTDQQQQQQEQEQEQHTEEAQESTQFTDDSHAHSAVAATISPITDDVQDMATGGGDEGLKHNRSKLTSSVALKRNRPSVVAPLSPTGSEEDSGASLSGGDGGDDGNKRAPAKKRVTRR